MKTALVIPSAGEPVEVQIADTGGSELEALQGIVGGWIEYVPTEQDVTLYCNEEGKILNLPYNRLATEVFGTLIRPDDYLAGDIAVLGPIDDEGETSSIDPSWIEYLKERL